MVMSKLQSRCDLFENATSFFLGEGTLSQALTQCATFDVRHDAILPETVYSTLDDGQNMLVRQGTEGFYLALKAHEVIIFAAMNQLNSHVTLRVFIKSEIDLRHASPR